MWGSVIRLLPYGLLVSVLLGTGYEAGAAPGKKKRRKRPRARTTVALTAPSPLENPGSPEFALFAASLRDCRLRRGENPGFLLLGDSHMQCEDFGLELVRYLRDSLQIPVGGRQFVFPYPLARTSHRSDMSFFPNRSWRGCRFTRSDESCCWGLAGWTAHCEEDTAGFFWRHNQGSFRAGDRVTVLCPPEPGRRFSLRVSDTSGRSVEMPYSDGFSGFSGVLPSAAGQLRFSLNRLEAGPGFVLQGLVVEPVLPGLRFGISGTNGARLDHYLLNPDFQRHLRVINPGLVMVSLGTNDVFSPGFSPEVTREALVQLLSRIRTALPGVAILLIGPPDHALKRRCGNPAIAALNALYEEVAGELDLVFWNQQKAMGGKGSVFRWRGRGLVTADMVHFTPDGYRLQARLLGRAFGTVLRLQGERR